MPLRMPHADEAGYTGIIRWALTGYGMKTMSIFGDIARRPAPMPPAKSCRAEAPRTRQLADHTLILAAFFCIWRRRPRGAVRNCSATRCRPADFAGHCVDQRRRSWH